MDKERDARKAMTELNNRVNDPIYPNDPRWPLTRPKAEAAPEAVKVAGQDKFILRLPPGMRERIKQAAATAKRSMNTEIVYALETLYPPEPDIFDVLDRVHGTIEQAQRADGLPYRDMLIKSLDALSERISSGLEFGQFRAPQVGPEYTRPAHAVGRIHRWRRAKEFGVEQSDLEREIERGLFRSAGGDRVRSAIELFDKGKPDRALRVFRLDDVTFRDRDAALKAIESTLRAYYAENWGDINEPPPWEQE